jgi:hypothetical protein
MPKRLGEGQVRIGEAQGGGGYLREIRGDEHRGGLRGAGQGCVFGVGDEGDFRGAGLFDAADSGDFEAAVSMQIRAQPLASSANFMVRL